MAEYNREVECWRKLMELVGTPQDGSDTPVTFSWDDATMTPIITVGRQSVISTPKSYYIERGSFESVIESI